MPDYHEIIVRLVGLDPEPEGPTIIGVVVRVPSVGNELKDIDRAVVTANRVIPAWPGSVETFKVEAMLGGRWHAEGDDDE